ncbi:efflux transporter, RND family, MFP subunit, partial [Vibrio parahaemolyticus V-223/04]
VKRCSL